MAKPPRLYQRPEAVDATPGGRRAVALRGLSVIVTRHPSGHCLFVTQNDHAAFAADLLAVWPALGRLHEDPGRASELRRLVLRATRLHDHGWSDLDAAPYLRDDGTAHDFRSLPTELRVELWDRATAHYVATDPSVALLITLHALYLFGLSEQIPNEVVARLETRAEELQDRVGWSERESQRLFRWLRMADALSLLTCAQEPTSSSFPRDFLPAECGLEESLQAELKRHEGTGPDSGDLYLALRPFPLAGTTTLQFSSRVVPRCEFTSSTDLALALAETSFRRVNCTIGPRGSARNRIKTR